MPLLPNLFGCDDSATRKACLWYSVFTCASIAICVLSGGVGPRWEQHVESDIRHAGVSILLVFSIAISELCIAVGGASNSCITETIRIKSIDAPKVKLPGAHDHWLTLLEYLAKAAAGTYMYMCSGGVAHTDSLAMNGARPVYIARFAQWSFAVPMLVLITNSAFIESRSFLIRTSWPSCWAAFSYVWAAWLMEVTPCHGIRWPMMVLALAGAICVCLDQFRIADECRSATCYGAKVGLLWYGKFLDAFYTAVFLFGRFGVISPTTEHMIYPYCDATAKVFQGALLAMIRSRESAYEVGRWCTAALAAGEDLKYLLRQAKIPALTIDLSGNIVQWNDSITHLTGLQEGSVHGKSLLSLSDIASRDDLSKVLTQKMTAFVTGTSSTDFEAGLVELSIVTHQGQDDDMPPVRRLAMTLVPKRNAVGEMEGITAIGQDLSEIADLKMVQDRRNALLGMLGHEIRSPVHGMMGLTGALLGNPQSEPLYRQLNMINGCTARLLDLANNIMDLAQSEKKRSGGITELKPTTNVDLSGMIEEAIVMIGNSVDKANKPLLKPGVQLINDSIGAEIPLVQGDANKCTQLFYNLLTNAAKFTDHGSISVTFRHLPQEKRLEVDVTDTGKGISKEGLKRIFLPFEQENSGDCRNYQGIGLGLAVCKEIAELHEGSLLVKSIVGQGSTFTFSLPCEGNMGTVKVQGDRVTTGRAGEPKAYEGQAKKMGSESVSLAPSKAELALGLASLSGSTTKPLVLSVDDDDVNQEVIKNALSDICEIACAMNGVEAFAYLDELFKSKQDFPELILLDIQMPGMSGFQVCEQVRTRYSAQGANLPVTMLSAKSPADKTAIESFDSGATDFMAKPFDTEILKRKVMAVIKLNAIGVRSAGVDLAASEACTCSKQYEMEAANARAHAANLEAELNATKVHAADALDKAKRLELKLVSATSASKLQKEEKHTLYNEYNVLQTQAQGKNLQHLSQATQLHLEASSQMHNSVCAESIELCGQDGEERQTPSMCKADALLGTSVAVKLLVSRLQVCRQGAKQCQQLLKACLHPSMIDRVRVDTMALVPLDGEKTHSQLTKLRQHTLIAVSELAMLEQVASNIGGIINLTDEQYASKRV